MRQRLQKAMAQAGLGSRRQCEDLIRAGRVMVNGSVAVLGAKVDVAQDDVRIDGERIREAEPLVYLALYKPRGVLSSLRSQGGRPTVREFVPVEQRLYPVGRLDIESEGLVLMMNDGEVAHRLTHPRFGHEKEYRVMLDRKPDQSQLTEWRKGVVLPDGKRALAARVTIEDPQKDSAWIRIVMREGRKRQIRDVAASLGLDVKRLIRIRHGPIRIGALKPGEYRFLSPREIEMLNSLASGKRDGRRIKTRETPRNKKQGNRLKQGVMEKRG